MISIDGNGYFSSVWFHLSCIYLVMPDYNTPTESAVTVTAYSNERSAHYSS